MLVLFAVAWGGVFVYRNLRGSRAAFGPVPNIVSRPADGGVSDVPSTNTTGLPFVLPNGFAITTFAKGLGKPRVLAFDPAGTLFTSIPSQSKIVALPDANGDGVADETITVLDGLNLPHGLAFHEGKLYVAETNAVVVYDYDASAKRATNRKKIIDLPGGGNHFSRTIGFGPDGKLYVSVGSSCNVCKELDPRRAKILVANADGSGLRDYATGLRNSVFFLWHPVTKDMWATDMGRDMLGDNVPPEEVNIVKDGGFYGWPYCYNNKIHDLSFDRSDEARQKCTGSIAPHITFQAHSAPLGLAVIPSGWPEEYRGDLLVAYHGSWNRSEPTGYKVARFDLDDNLRSKGESDFLRGWLVGDAAVGRPVDLVFDSGGRLFISDDKAGVVYRIQVL